MQHLSSISEILFVDQTGLKEFPLDRIAYIDASGDQLLLIDDTGNEIHSERAISFFAAQLPAEKFYRINSTCMVCIAHVTGFIVLPEKITVITSIHEILKADALDLHLYQDFRNWLEYN